MSTHRAQFLPEGLETVPTVCWLGLARPVWGAIYLGVAAATLPAILPVVVGVMTERLAFGPVRAGYVAAINMGGVAIGSVIATYLAARYWSWGRLIRSGASVMICANALTMMSTDFGTLAVLRLMAGLGEGQVAALCYAAMGRSKKPSKAVALYLAGQGLVGAVGMGVIPILIVSVGWPWLFLGISIVALPAFWLAPSIQSLSVDTASDKNVSGAWMSWLGVYALGGVFVYFAGMSAVWAFVERMGHAKAFSLPHLSIALSASAVANMCGALLVAFYAHRLRVATGLMLGVLAVLAGLSALMISNDWKLYVAAASLFFFAWGFYYPFQFKVLADLNRGAEMTTLLPLMTGGGLAIGPAVGGLLLSTGGTALLCSFGIACVVASTLGSLHLLSRARAPQK